MAWFNIFSVNAPKTTDARSGLNAPKSENVCRQQMAILERYVLASRLGAEVSAFAGAKTVPHWYKNHRRAPPFI